jgi:hypothetical protein
MTCLILNFLEILNFKNVRRKFSDKILEIVCYIFNQLVGENNHPAFQKISKKECCIKMTCVKRPLAVKNKKI